jgi:hypothetical protein
MQHDQQRARHGADDSEPHEEMRDTLLHYGGGFDYGSTELGAFTFFCRDQAQFGFVDSERVGMYWCLSKSACSLGKGGLPYLRN